MPPPHRPDRSLLALVLGVIVLAGCSGDAPRGPSSRPQHRLLVIGWDGATFDLVDPLVRAGRLPHVARLLAAGRSATLASTIVPISSAAWTSAVTGKGPGETGVYSFFEPAGEGYEVQLVSARSNQAAPLWRILRARGLRSHIFGVPLTFPPEPVFGSLVAGMLSPFEAEYAYPAGHAAELRARGFVPDLGLWRENQEISITRFAEQLEIKTQVLEEKLARPDWELAFFAFKSLDVMSHFLFDGDPEGEVAAHMERLDATLGRLLAAVKGPRDQDGLPCNVMLVSDHGFTTYPRRFNLHRWMLEQGFSAPLDTQTEARPEAGPLATRRAGEHAARLASLDMARTRAWATTCEGNFGSLRLNQQAREAQGLVTEQQRTAVLEEIAASLRALEAPDGQALVRQIWSGEELYPGDKGRHVVPDLVFETLPEYQVSSTTLEEVFSAPPSPWPLAAPDHALDGIFVLAGPGVTPASTRGHLSILDVAPTCLSLLNQPVHLEMQGSPWSEALRARGSLPAPVSERDDPNLSELAEQDPFDPGVHADVRKRLEGLGYFH